MAKNIKLIADSSVADQLQKLGETEPDVHVVSLDEATGSEDVYVGEDDSRVPPGVAFRLILNSGKSSNGKVYVPRESFDKDPGSWIECAILMANQKRHAERLRAKVEMLSEVETLMSTTQIEDTFRIAAETALRFLRTEKGRLLMYDAFEERYRCVWSNDGQDDSTKFLPGVSAELLQEAMEEAADYGYESDSKGGWEVVIPLRSDEDPIGVFSARLHRDVREPEAARAARWIRVVTLILSSAFHLTRSNELAMKDDLTRAFNRRFFDSYLDQEIERGSRYGTTFSVIFLDLDNLKGVNDLHGHMCGSRTLQEVAKRILAAVRAIDKVIRFGGDEFCIILPQTDEEQAKAVAQRVRSSIADDIFHIDDGISVVMTASFGIASFPKHARSKEDLIRRADAAMYQVKESSKNAIGIAEDE